MLMWAWPSAVAISEIAPGRLGTATITRAARRARRPRRSTQAGAGLAAGVAHEAQQPVAVAALERPLDLVEPRARSRAAPRATAVAVGEQDVGPERAGWSRRRASGRRTTARPSAAPRARPGAVAAAWLTRAPARTWGRWETSAIRRSWTSRVDRQRAARRPTRPGRGGGSNSSGRASAPGGQEPGGAAEERLPREGHAGALGAAHRVAADEALALRRARAPP